MLAEIRGGKQYLWRPITQCTFMCAKVCWHEFEFDREHLGNCCNMEIRLTVVNKRSLCRECTVGKMHLKRKRSRCPMPGLYFSSQKKTTKFRVPTIHINVLDLFGSVVACFLILASRQNFFKWFRKTLRLSAKGSQGGIGKKTLKR